MNEDRLKAARRELDRLMKFGHKPQCDSVHGEADSYHRYDRSCNLCNALKRVEQIKREIAEAT